MPLDHLHALEAAGIQIIREVVAEFARPVMLYSTGKDSSVLLRLAQKAFYPGPIPFPLLPIDTTYTFREMGELRRRYIAGERIPVVPLYFAKEREVIVRGDSLISLEHEFVPRLPGERPELVMCRMRSLGCSPCTGAVRSTADTVPKIIEELIATRHSERQLRIIDHDQDGSMELKKREGYF